MATAAMSLVYSAALAMLTITLPLLALAAHYSRPLIGVLTALSAVTQLVSRLGSARAMRHFTDRNVVAGACLTIAVSALVLVWSHQVVLFVIAELIQGLARGMFWTGTQAHVVRSRRKAVGRLATVNFVSSFGLLAGPPIAGVLSSRSFATALWVAAALGLISAVMAATMMSRLDVFAAPSSGPRQKVWSCPGVRVGCWAGTTAGAWRGLVGSYIPVALRAASESSTLVGIMVGVANGASLVGTASMGAIGSRRTRATFAAGVLAAGAGVALTGIAAHQTVLVAAFIALSGVGAGMLQTLGPATAATSVEMDRRGDAVAVAGSFRAGALFVSPLGTAALLDVTSLPAALLIAGAVLGLPVLSAARSKDWQWKLDAQKSNSQKSDTQKTSDGRLPTNPKR